MLCVLLQMHCPGAPPCGMTWHFSNSASLSPPLWPSVVWCSGAVALWPGYTIVPPLPGYLCPKRIISNRIMAMHTMASAPQALLQALICQSSDSGLHTGAPQQNLTPTKIQTQQLLPGSQQPSPSPVWNLPGERAYPDRSS